MAAGKAGALSVNYAWNSVPVEERLDILSKAHASGLMAGIGSLFVMGSIGYGFDNIWILACGVGFSFFLAPMFSSYTWRRNKPAAILAYLAARAVSRRYAYGYDCPDLEVILIYRGEFREIFENREVEELERQRMDVGAADLSQKKQVWIALLRGAVVILSERRGGAKLEFYSPITNDVTVRKSRTEEDLSESALIVQGVGPGQGRKVLIDSKSKGAQYVFEKQLGRLVFNYRSPWARRQEIEQANAAAETAALL
jgi:hypothetical protein